LTLGAIDVDCGPMPLQTLVRWLLPREDHFYAILERQAAVTHQAAVELAKYHDGSATPQAIRDEVQRLEHEGDACVRDMLKALARSFVTPIDREDLQRVSKKLDDILDLVNLAARTCVLFGVGKPTEPMLGLIERIETCTRIFIQAIGKLRTNSYHAMIDLCHEVGRLEKQGDDVFRDALGRLFQDPAIDAKTILREKEILEDLEKAINRCEQVAETLVNVAVKHA
jgi:uncharacterized protein